MTLFVYRQQGFLFYILKCYNICIMKRKTLFTFLSLVVVFIFFLNFVAGKLYWYSSIWWFDILMHFLGGFWLGLLFLWVFYKDLFNECFRLNGTSGHCRYAKEDRGSCLFLANLLS